MLLCFYLATLKPNTGDFKHGVLPFVKKKKHVKKIYKIKISWTNLDYDFSCRFEKDKWKWPNSSLDHSHFWFIGLFSILESLFWAFFFLIFWILLLYFLFKNSVELFKAQPKGPELSIMGYVLCWQTKGIGMRWVGGGRDGEGWFYLVMLKEFD